MNKKQAMKILQKLDWHTCEKIASRVPELGLTGDEIYNATWYISDPGGYRADARKTRAAIRATKRR